MKLAPRIGLIGILGFTACIYALTLRNGFVNLDDPMLVTENTYVQEASIKNIGYVFTHFDPELYIPITFLTYQLETWTLGPDAWHFHLLSLILHLAAIWLVYEIVQRFTDNKNIGLMTALLFAVHPINAETVLWVSARKDILSAVFFLGSLLCFMLYKEKTARRWYYLSLGLFGLALGSKVTVVTLPVIVMLMLETPRNLKNSMKNIGPFLLLAFIFGIIAIAGKGAVNEQFSIVNFFLMACRSILFYLTLIVVPSGQSAIHSIEPHDVFSPLLPVAIGVVMLTSWIIFRYRKNVPLVCAGWIFFLVTLAPSFLHYTRGNENFMLGSERYMYLPSIGIFLIIASLTHSLWQKKWITRPTRLLLAIGATSIVLVVSYLTVLRTFVFEGPVIFSIDILQKNPQDGRTWYNLGVALEDESRPMEAEEAYKTALKVKSNLADAAINLGLLFLKEGRTDEGMTMLKHATVIRPEYFKGHFNHGVALQNTGKFSEAEISYRKTIELFPDFPMARRNLATVLGAQKKFSEAMIEYEELAKIDPTFRAEFEHLKAKIR